MEDEHKLKEALQRWQIEPPPPHLADSIVRRAIALPQRQTALAPVLQFLQRALSDWRYGLAYKVAGLALCATLGLALGAQQTMMADADEIDVVALAFSGGPGDPL